MPAQAGELRERVLREAAVRAGFVRAEKTHIPVQDDLATVGKLLFESKELSLDRETACASCHLDRFGSADGLPNAIGTLGQGHGIERLTSGGDIIPRNTLPFWGRGGLNFDVFFWDGKVDASSGKLHSQFEGSEPSQDPLVIAVHLPPVEIGEMVSDIIDNQYLEKESVDSANVVYEALAKRIQENKSIGPLLAKSAGVEIERLSFLNVAEAIAAFIRQNFRLKPTRFHRFVFDQKTLSADELAGGLLFYGKGKCSSCHNGPYFSDLEFHAIPFPQVGFGMNGFGIDYGRFNVSLVYNDRYKFRTPPLYNVTETAPYSHSGSVMTLGKAILAHTDPLAIYRRESMTGTQRADFYERLKIWSQEPLASVYLQETEIRQLEAFLATLSYESDLPVNIVD